MQQTTNYQLSQWDPEDRILRTDFNSDNEKIDTALKSQASTLSSHTSSISALTKKAGAQLLASGDIDQGDMAADISLSTIRWQDWRTIHIVLTVNCKEGSGYTYSAYANGSSTLTFGDGRSNGPQGGEFWTNLYICLFPFFENRWYLMGYLLSSEELTFKKVNIPYKDFTSLHLEFPNAGYHFDAGSTYQVWGEK